VSRGLRFEWDSRKALANKAKHGISFEEACEVFGDKLSITISDPEHSATEFREITIGSTSKHRIVVVSHTARDGTIRIISARKADRSEISQYNEVN
jgi:uncharacterized DUF497 family protein